MTSNDNTRREPSPINIDDLISQTSSPRIRIVVLSDGALYFDSPNSVYNKIAIFGILEPVAKIASFFEMMPCSSKTGRISIGLKPGVSAKILADRIAQHLMAEFEVIAEVDDRRSQVK